MVSSVLNMTDEELIERLTRIRAENADDPEYKLLRADLPAEWPI
jgi:hypothetical protein